MILPMKRVRPVTVILLALILVLGYSLAVRQRREARLRAALALYKKRATGEIVRLRGDLIPTGWPEGTTLAEVIEDIKHAPCFSRDYPKGLPILVDPDGLREAGQSLSSPVPAPPPDDPNAQPLKLREKLRIILDPLGLAAEVKDGAIVITSRGRVAEPLAPAVPDEE
jgi:hypothetical protein